MKGRIIMGLQFIFWSLVLFGVAGSVYAQEDISSKVDKASINSVERLIDYSVQNSSDSLISEAEVKIQSTMSSIASKLKSLPQIDVYGTYQNATYFDNRINKNGTLVPNTGSNRIYGASVSYDLQKLFGPEDQIAKGHAEHSEIQDKLSKLNIRRVVKKDFALYHQIKFEIKEIDQTLAFMQKVEAVIERGHKQGVFNEIEQGQYKIQKEFLLADKETKNHELEIVLSSFGLLMNLPLDEVIIILPRVKEEVTVEIDNRNEKALLKESLTSDYHLAKLELDSFQTIPLPTLFVRSFYQDPTIPSFQGRNHFTEYGLTFNVTNLFIKSAHKTELQEKVAKSMAMMKKAQLDYENNIQVAQDQKKHFQSQERFLKALKAQTEAMLKKSFIYYGQKRIDVLTLMDISQKDLLASQRLLLNEYQQSLINADLEYYFGRN